MTREHLDDLSIGRLRENRNSFLKTQKVVNPILAGACSAIFPLTWYMTDLMYSLSKRNKEIGVDSNSTIPNATFNVTDNHPNIGSGAAFLGLLGFSYCCILSPIYSLSFLHSSYIKFKETPDVAFSRSQNDILDFLQKEISNADVGQIESRVVKILKDYNFKDGLVSANYRNMVELESGIIKLKIIELCSENEDAKAYFKSVAERLENPADELFNKSNIRKVLEADDELEKEDIRASKLPRDIVGLLENSLVDGEYERLVELGRQCIFKELIFVLDEVDKQKEKNKDDKSRSDSFDLEAQRPMSEMETTEFSPFLTSLKQPYL